MIKILKGTLTPLQDIGVSAGVCWGADIENVDKNKKRALDCITSGHSRVMEYPDVTLVIDGYSARCIRELYTHIIGTTRLQESTRYVDCNNFNYYKPRLEKDPSIVYAQIMDNIKEGYKKLIELGVSKEDAANVLPLGMHSKVVLKINSRALEHFANMRMCNRAYKEIRSLAYEIKLALEKYSPEWKELVDIIMVPKCKKDLFCTEKFCCGLSKKKEDIQK